MKNNQHEFLPDLSTLKVPEIFSPNTYERLSHVLWQEHLHWLYSLGWKDALKTERRAWNRQTTEHRTLDMLKVFVHNSGYVNAHTGLTSSDIEDNVRRAQISLAIRQIIPGLKTAIGRLRGLWHNAPIQHGYTHWQKAMPVSGSRRMIAWTDPILRVIDCSDLKVSAKALGGPVGDNSGLRRLFDHLADQGQIPNILGVKGQLLLQTTFRWHLVNLSPPENLFPTQSCDFVEETRILTFISTVASLLAKMGNDIRFLCSTGDVKIKKSELYVGSSSIPRKNNPIELEKMVSICRSLFSVPQDLFQIVSSNGMERTLDGSWQARRLYKDTMIKFQKVIEILWSLEFEFGPGVSNEESIKDEIIEHQIEGKTRVEAFMISNQQQPEQGRSTND